MRHFRLDRIKPRRGHSTSATSRAPTSTRPPTSRAGRAPARSRRSRIARVWISPEQARWAREERSVVAELDDGSIVVELGFEGDATGSSSEVLKEAGDAAVLEPADVRDGGARRRRAAAGSLPAVSRRDQIVMTRRRAGRVPRRAAHRHLRDDRRATAAPHLMPLWYVVRDGELWAWTYAKSQKVRNLERDPRCTLQVEAATEYGELRGVMIDGEAVLAPRLADVAPVGAELAARYGGARPRPGAGDARCVSRRPSASGCSSPSGAA